MRMISTSFLLAATLLLFAASAKAQMVVNPNIGERVDHPFARRYVPSASGYRIYRRRYAHGFGRRILAVRSGFPTPQPFGWFECCL